MLSKYLIGFGGIAAVGGGAGVGIYYGTQQGKPTDQKPDQNPSSSQTTSQTSVPALAGTDTSSPGPSTLPKPAKP